VSSLFAFILLSIDSSFAYYAAFFLVLVLSGIGLPMPEEVTLISAGYFAHLGLTGFWLTIIILTVAVVLADIAGYLFGRFAGNLVWERIDHIKIFAVLMGKARWYFEKYGEKVVFLSRPLLGVRAAVPMLVGHFKMNFAKFFIYDVLAAIPWTFFMVTLSYYLGSSIDLITKVREIKHAVYVFIAFAIIIYAIIKLAKISHEYINENLK